MRRMSESEHQQEFIRWCKLHKTILPDLAHLYAIPNGAATTENNRSRLVAEGLKQGVSDLHLPVPKGPYHGLWLEMKTSKGIVTPEQARWIRAMRSLGHAALVVRSWADATAVIERYLALGSYGTVLVQQNPNVPRSKT